MCIYKTCINDILVGKVVTTVCRPRACNNGYTFLNIFFSEIVKCALFGQHKGSEVSRGWWMNIQGLWFVTEICMTSCVWNEAFQNSVTTYGTLSIGHFTSGHACGWRRWSGGSQCRWSRWRYWHPYTRWTWNMLSWLPISLGQLVMGVCSWRMNERISSLFHHMMHFCFYKELYW